MNFWREQILWSLLLSFVVWTLFKYWKNFSLIDNRVFFACLQNFLNNLFLWGVVSLRLEYSKCGACLAYVQFRFISLNHIVPWAKRSKPWAHTGVSSEHNQMLPKIQKKEKSSKALVKKKKTLILLNKAGTKVKFTD